MSNMKFIRGFAAEKTGQTLTEYTLLIGFILFAVLGVAAGYGKRIANVTNSLNSNLAVAAAATSSGACRAESPRSECNAAQPSTGIRSIRVNSHRPTRP